jgi:hypothetical protein
LPKFENSRSLTITASSRRSPTPPLFAILSWISRPGESVRKKSLQTPSDDQSHGQTAYFVFLFSFAKSPSDLTASMPIARLTSAFAGTFACSRNVLGSGIPHNLSRKRLSKDFTQFLYIDPPATSRCIVSRAVATESRRSSSAACFLGESRTKISALRALIWPAFRAATTGAMHLRSILRARLTVLEMGMGKLFSQLFLHLATSADKNLAIPADPLSLGFIRNMNDRQSGIERIIAGQSLYRRQEGLESCWHRALALFSIALRPGNLFNDQARNSCGDRVRGNFALRSKPGGKTPALFL